MGKTYSSNKMNFAYIDGGRKSRNAKKQKQFKKLNKNRK